jgi:hypothetical protein
MEHYSCGIAGLAVAVLSSILLYPHLLAFVQHFEWLSSTAFVLSIVFAWTVVWLSLEAAWEWKAGRLRE